MKISKAIKGTGIIKRLLHIDSNEIRTHNHLVCKWLSVCLRINWLWVQISLLSLKLQVSCLLWARSSLIFRKTLKLVCDIKTISLLHTLPRKSLISIYNFFIGPYLDSCEVIYDQPNNDSFCTKIELIQCNAALAITDSIKVTSQIKTYKELGLNP